MKKPLMIFVCFISVLYLYAAPSIEVRNNNADIDVAETIKDELTNKLSYLSNHQISIELTQSGDVLTIDYIISPEEKNGQEVCNDIWRDLDQSIRRVISSIQKETAYASETSNAISSQDKTVYPQTTADYNKVASQPSNASQTTMPTQSSVKTSYTSPSFNLEDVKAGRAHIGGLLTFPDGSRGVIFYMDNHGHGLAVSLDRTKVKWENVNKSRECHDIVMLANEDGVKACTFGLGSSNTNYIINELGMNNAPAAKWCLNHGENWYLPSSGELWQLLVVANKSAAVQGPISRALQNVGGESLEQTWYWSSSENDVDEAINLSSWGHMASENKYDVLEVRAIRVF
ncbi:MAG: hypothetical protein IKO26_08270 [Paludibacteraceae bacterium]|nr:hypothetical protein [Paludibacteraceae bacterium]